MERSGKLVKVPLSKIRSGVIEREEIKDAVVAYLDLLGFARKTEDEAVMSLLDFSGSLALASRERPLVKVKMFSDGAFVVAPANHALDVLFVIRTAFRGWIADGLFIRGGLARGRYLELRAIASQIGSGSFFGSFFLGNAVNGAVRIHRAGQGALLFVEGKCARLYFQNYKEKVFGLGKDKLLGWGDDKQSLWWFAGISTFRLLKLYSSNHKSETHLAQKLLNNILYSRNVQENSMIDWEVLAILAWSDSDASAKGPVMRLLRISEETLRDFRGRLKTNFKITDFEFMNEIAESDSGLCRLGGSK